MVNSRLSIVGGFSNIWNYRIIQERLDLKGQDLQTGSFRLKQIIAATNNFDSVNKIGEGGFGPVYRGLLSDVTLIAVKQLSSKSTQGNREFLIEIGAISCLHHPNLVKLYGCCVEGNQLLLVYEYMENNCLSRALFGQENWQLKLDWSTRQRICIGIARGLAFLHEESRLKIVHRDIKGTNACHRQQSGNLIELVDERPGSEFSKLQAERIIKIALLCANVSPASRPTMSEVVSMLEGSAVIPDVSAEASSYSRDLRCKAIRDHHKQIHNQSSRGSKAIYSRPTRFWHGLSSSASEHDLYEINMESYLRSNATRSYDKPSDRHNSVGQTHISTSVPAPHIT
ncbi:hypothetical protein CRYUN_Cryun37aG0090500 [Craigia yunnanensis]